ncbi:MAG: hypothetical protein WCV00_03570 [Verrucomicrobiia bacterium]|jgi:hypothetical protein
MSDSRLEKPPESDAKQAEKKDFVSAAQALSGEARPRNDRSLIAELGGLSVIAAFILYAVGFLIWNAHLAQYGIITVGILRVEFLSAALVYLIIVFSFAGPAAILIDTYAVEKEDSLLKIPPFQTWILFSIWVVVIQKTETLFFPGNKLGSYFFIILLTVAAIHAGVAIYLVFRRPNSVFKKLFCNPDYFVWYPFAMSMGALLWNPSVSKGFLLVTILLYSTVTNLGWILPLRRHWPAMPLPLKLLAVGAVVLFLAENVRTFGRSQFKSIPQEVGGGKPLTAVLKISPRHNDLLPLLGLEWWTPSIGSNSTRTLISTNLPARDSKMGTNLGTTSLIALVGTNACSSTNVTMSLTIPRLVQTATNGFCGPVEILFKTDVDLFFIPKGTNQPRDRLAEQIRLDMVEAIRFLKE